MAEIITDPHHTHVVHRYDEDSSAGTGATFLAIAFLIVAIVLFFYFLLPAIGGIRSPQINVPDKINVNVSKQ
jgi:hypothetical protein